MEKNINALPPKLNPSEPLEAEKITKKFKEFSNNTTLHGIKYTLGDNHGTVRRVLWLVILLCSLVFLIHEITRTALQYQQYMSLLAISAEEQEELTLPAVTVSRSNEGQGHLVLRSFLKVNILFC